MMILSYNKGKTSISELCKLPYQFLQSLYYKAYQQGLKDQQKGKGGMADMEEALEEMVDG